MHHTSMSKRIIIHKVHQLQPADSSSVSATRDEFGIVSSAASAVNQVTSGLTYKSVLLSWKDVFVLAGEIQLFGGQHYLHKIPQASLPI